MITMLLWGFNFVALKLLLLQMQPLVAALIRGVLMAACLFAVCLSQGISLKIPKGMAWRVHLQGALSMGIYMVLFTLGMQTASPAEGAMILGAGPVFTLFLAVLARQEKFRWAILGGTLVAFTGVMVVILSSPGARVGDAGFAGVMMLLASALVWALATVVSKPILGKMDPIGLTTLAMPAGVAVLVPFGLPHLAETNWAALNATSWFGLAYFTLVAGALGFFLFYRGVNEVGAAGAMLYQYFVSPIAAFSGYFVLAKPLVPLQFLGFGIVILGVLLATRARAHPVEPSPG
jgi:drug/metabolite transporter (DMT)-like permease